MPTFGLHFSFMISLADMTEATGRDVAVSREGSSEWEVGVGVGVATYSGPHGPRSDVPIENL